ncbi:MAG: oxidoreductase [Gemmatimonadota bacterium]|nr:MAG: oxidoreductase [Gemmatimonadota bacterium]
MTERFDLPAGRLETRFSDKAPALSESEARREAARCLYCFDAPCIRSCPTSIDIPTFIRKIATGNLRGSARTILSANLLGASCARVCPVEVLCEGSCVYHDDGQPPIAIGRLQRHAMDHGGGPELLPRLNAARPGSIGLVGGGPASLACAGQLALLGHRPVIYEKRALPGGLNTTGVAPYKLPAEDALEEVESILALGVDLETGVEIGRDLTAEEVLARHDAVFLGPGLGPDSRLRVPGEEGPGVLGAVEWIERIKNDASYSLEGITQAVVVGGGNTAIDAARELRGLGVETVYLLYRRSAAEMGAYRHESDEALRGGVVLVEDVVVTEVLREGDALSGVRLAEAQGGRATDVEHGVLPTDLVLLAIGQSKLVELARSFPGVEVDDRGRIVADPATGRTGNPRVFTGGDALNGGKEVVNAAHDGQAAARAIDELIRDGGPRG